MRALYTFDGDRFVPSELTRGPWDEGVQHGGPPLALLTRALEHALGERQLALVQARFLKGVPLAPLQVKVEPVHEGRVVSLFQATLLAEGRPVMQATGQGVMPSPSPSVHTAPRWASPEDCEPLVLEFFTHDVGYHRAIELRTVEGSWGTTPIRLWTRPVVELVEGQPTSPRQRVAILADAQSGMGAPVDPLRYNYANPEVSVTFARTPSMGWIGFDITSMVGEAGVGASRSLLRDADGWFGGASQTLLVRPRG